VLCWPPAGPECPSSPFACLGSAAAGAGTTQPNPEDLSVILYPAVQILDASPGLKLLRTKRGTNLRQGHILFCLQVKLRCIRVTAPHTLDGTRVGLNVNHITNLRHHTTMQVAQISNTILCANLPGEGCIYL
jgi:hypothetical protein